MKTSKSVGTSTVAWEGEKNGRVSNRKREEASLAKEKKRIIPENSKHHVSDGVR
jgi:hypothetical protein